ncbi:putative cellulose-binding GDSL lipase/acylhydrolase [Aspergillus novofumigatus IBT 16806]|uniref:Putative cellulose-binding GDSL lipase/acylhydrolase n=1 Tax=Aspergillus novofumigatus (strain IBT 16806) TaxID=1392255 RepID=A0A2I1CJX0_ASPN1|nr:putative cellulose-binding GDSL lipase/acylhydrolase [Aspergillus novofumigatus IBT 16806]PKX97924.1 putative cellulose-binding GDSL lipase/acylhydrolase [Aspergillus novofumigatus IBT 16806]
MLHISIVSLTVSLALALGANAQAALYAQCGGQGYSGPTSCVAGAVCKVWNPCSMRPWNKYCTDKVLHHFVSHPQLHTESSCTHQVSGDSYSQTGFNINGTKPSAENPLGNPTLPGWTTTGGLNWIGFLVSKYNTSLTLSYNFAYGGATTNASLVAPFTSTVLSFIDQVTEFTNSIALKPSYAPWTSENTLVGVWMGVNDVGNSYWQSSIDELLIKIMDSYFGQLQILYNAGVRNYVLLGVPPINRSPLMLSQGTSATTAEAAVIAKYNNLIATYLANFKSKNSGVTATIVDTQAPFNKALDNPTAYGAPNATCYNSDGTSCLWFNDYHPGVAIQNLTAQAVASALKGSFF